MGIDYSIKLSNRRSITIVIERDRSVVVRAPMNVTRELVDKEISKRKKLILEKIRHNQKYSERVEAKEYVSGESIPYLGRLYKLEITEDPLSGIIFDNRFLVSRNDLSKANDLFKSWYKERGLQIVVPRVKHFARQLGVTYNKINLVDFKYRWGSCTPKNNLNFNWRIIMAPMNVVEYVIVHELAHLIETNHTPRFWNTISIQLPDYVKAKEWLKENGELLETDFA